MSESNGNLSDQVLVVAAILGDLEAFDELVLRYRPAVVRVARTIVVCQVPDYVEQESLVLAGKALPAIDNPAQFGA